MALLLSKSPGIAASLLRPSAAVAGLSTLAPRLGSLSLTTTTTTTTTNHQDDFFNVGAGAASNVSSFIQPPLMTRHISTFGPVLQQPGAATIPQQPGSDHTADDDTAAAGQIPQMHAGSPAHPTTPGQWGDSYMLMHPVYSSEYVESVKPTHKAPQKIYEYAAYYAIQTVRTLFDKITGYGHNNMTRDKWMVRTIFLETVAGVPGMVAGMLRHMKSLRSMNRDNGWIHTLLEEAENERMHLLTFLMLKEPGPVFRGMVLLGQGVFFNIYMLTYILMPKTCHAAVGYLEEEAVKTYTHLLEDLDAGRIPEWKDEPAPPIALNYWRLQEGATLRDMFLAIRADEACHSHVNHTLSELNQNSGKNPFTPGSHQVP